MRGSGRRIWADLPRRTPFYIFTAFVFTYGTTVLHSSRDLLLVRDGPAFRVSLGSPRAQADISLRGGHDGGVRLCLLRAVEHRSIRLDFSCHRTLACPARHDVGPAGGVDRRMRPAAAALQRLLARLPLSSITPGCPAPLIATAPCRHRFGLCHRRLYPLLRGGQRRHDKSFCPIAPTATSRKRWPTVRRPGGPAETKDRRRALRRRGFGTIYPR